jgi:hypothetical protein
MPALVTIAEYLFWLTIAAYVALYLRLRRESLQHTYRVFAAYLLFHVGRSGALAAVLLLWPLFHKGPHVQFGNNFYGWIWLLSEPVLWLFYILLVLELYSLVFRDYKGIASLSRWAIVVGLVIAIVVSSFTLPTDLSNPSEQFPILRYFFAIERGVTSSLVIFLLSISAFLVWFPVPLRRNVVLHSMVYALYFMTTALALLLRNVRGNAVVNAVNVTILCLDLVCLGLWIVFLNRAGESRPATVRHPWSPQQEKFLMEQLAAINSTIMRSGRKRPS